MLMAAATNKENEEKKTDVKPKKKTTKKKVQETGNEYLDYKGKKLVRVGNEIYYGNPDEPYIVTFRLEDSEDLMDLSISKRVIIELKTNEGKASKLIRQAERDGLYKAFDIGMFLIDQALESNK